MLGEEFSLLDGSRTEKKKVKQRKIGEDGGKRLVVEVLDDVTLMTGDVVFVD